MKEIKLPEKYLNQMKGLLGQEEFSLYMESFKKERLYGLRVNTAKISAEEFCRRCAFPLKPVPWISNGFYYSGNERPARDPYYYAGLYYLQEPSAMTPASLLPISPGDRVLDLCAAPGGKSTELGARLLGDGLLVSNDISNSRAKALLKNLEMWGIGNLCVTSEEPARLCAAFGEYFHKILIDAPCSGEGMFRKDESMIKSYEQRGPEYYAPIQKQLLEEASGMLMPGGMLLYSTCTFSVRENEEVILRFLEGHEEMELMELEPFDGASGGMGISGCIRLFPHKLRGEGHFIALLKKKEGLFPGKAREPKSRLNFEKQENTTLPTELKEFLGLIDRQFDEMRIFIKNDQVYYLPEALPLPKNLRYLRTGLFLGELRKGHFQPSQALAMNLRAGEFGRVVSWNREDERVIRYLKGETISFHEEEPSVNGWSLVCADNFPLGFAKGMGRTLKNKYYPGWRWQ